MNIFVKLLQSLFNILIPEEKRVASLLKLSPGDMRRLLPSSRILSEPDVYPLFDYGNKAVKMAIWAVKYRRNPEMIRRMSGYLAEEILDTMADAELFEGADKKIILVPIPMSKKRFREKGFNQCEDLCLQISKIEPWLKYAKALEKVKETGRQTKLSREKRLENLKNSFQIKNPEEVRGKSAVVVDDVFTTGATFAEAKRALQEAGAKRVFGFFVAH